MKRSSLLLLACSLAAPASAGPKVEVIAAEVRPTGGAASAAAPAALAIRSNLVPSLSPVASLNGVPALSQAPSVLTSPSALVEPAKLRVPNDAPAAPVGALGSVEKIAAAAAVSPADVTKAPVEQGRARGAHDFDAATLPQDGKGEVAGTLSANAPRLSPATAAARRAARGPARPFKDLALDAAEVGAFAAAIQLLSSLLFLAAGAHAAHPILAGALWGLGAAEMIKHLARLHGRIVGGWQASHDQKMRHDYGTGELKDIRGHAYGEDRYDKWAPGELSPRALAAIDVFAVLMGLPWLIGADPVAFALYLGTAGGAIALRRILSARIAHVAPAADVKHFEYDR